MAMNRPSPLPYGGAGIDDYKKRVNSDSTVEELIQQAVSVARAEGRAIYSAGGQPLFTAQDLAEAVKKAVNDALKEIDLVIEVWRTSFDVEKDYPSDLHSADVLDKHIFPALAGWTETDTRTINALREDIRKQEERLLLAVKSEREACIKALEAMRFYHAKNPSMMGVVIAETLIEQVREECVRTIRARSNPSVQEVGRLKPDGKFEWNPRYELAPLADSRIELNQCLYVKEHGFNGILYCGEKTGHEGQHKDAYGNDKGDWYLLPVDVVRDWTPSEAVEFINSLPEPEHSIGCAALGSEVKDCDCKVSVKTRPTYYPPTIRPLSHLREPEKVKQGSGKWIVVDGVRYGIDDGGIYRFRDDADAYDRTEAEKFAAPVTNYIKDNEWLWGDVTVSFNALYKHVLYDNQSKGVWLYYSLSSELWGIHDLKSGNAFQVKKGQLHSNWQKQFEAID